MRRSIAALGLLLPLASIAQRPWQEITFPSLGEVASHFRTPPREYGAIHWAIWGGELTRERIVREFDSLTRSGIYVVNFGPARGMQPKYLSPEHLALTKFAVEEAAKRGMKVWLADEGSYPSGFAGGQISEDYPQLRMQGIVADIRISVAPGQTISMPAPPDTLAATIVSSAGGGGRGAANPAPSTSEPLAIADGRIVWTAPPEGRREIVLIRHVFRSSPTRYINRADGTYSKDSLYSLIDYLNPEATRAFLKTTHEVYKDLFGGEFGKTVLGFFGDEPDYTGFMPWTPTLLEQFRQAKGYDLQPYLPALFAPQMTPEAWRVKADYWDVWSGIFSKSFFGVQAEWCAKNNLDKEKAKHGGDPGTTRRVAPPRGAHRSRAAAPSCPPPSRVFIERLISGEVVRTPHGEHFETETLWERHRRHGSVDISDLADLPEDLLEPLSAGAIPRAHPTRWAFLDTETTGLAGGTGTYAFLIGVGSIEPAGFRLRQFFMRDYGEEAFHALPPDRVPGALRRAHHLQRQGLRPAAARNALPHGPVAPALRPHGASRPAVRRAPPVEAAPGKLPPGGPGKPHSGRRARGRSARRDDPLLLFRISAHRAAPSAWCRSSITTPSTSCRWPA